MIVFAAIAPHSPLLIPSIGKDQQPKLAKTLAAYAGLEQALDQAKPETIVIISPHGAMYPDAFCGNMSDTFTAVLKEFGDHGTSLTARVDFLTLDHIQRLLRTTDTPFTLSTENELDYAYTVPLIFLTPHLAKWQLIPIATSSLDPQQHFEFGRQLKRVLHAETKRIAVIASADLSHHISVNAAQGGNSEGPQFDQAVRKAVLGMDAPGLLALDAGMVEKAGQCGYKPILTLLGILDQMNCRPRELSYEAPFGVGYLTELFEIA